MNMQKLRNDSLTHEIVPESPARIAKSDLDPIVTGDEIVLAETELGNSSQ